MGKKKANQRQDATKVALDAAATALLSAARDCLGHPDDPDAIAGAPAWALIALAEAMVPDDFHVRVDRHKLTDDEAKHVPSEMEYRVSKDEAGVFCCGTLPGMIREARTPIDPRAVAKGREGLREWAGAVDFTVADELMETGFWRLVCVVALAREGGADVRWPNLFTETGAPATASA